MNNFLFKEWLIYIHLKTDEHSLHSPFFYDFYTSLIKKKKVCDFKELESIREKFLTDKQKINITDYGAGSQVTKGNVRSIANIAKHSLSSKKFSSFLFRLIKKFRPQHIIELGTSLGLNTAYMAQSSSAKLTSFEGDPAILSLAKKHLNQYQHLSLIEGNIDQTLPQYLENLQRTIDMVYIDANHTFEATLNYFNLLSPHFNQQSICIIDDIHWSKGMKKAWEAIKLTPSVSTSIDLFDAGILFFDPNLNREHLILDF